MELTELNRAVNSDNNGLKSMIFSSELWIDDERGYDEDEITELLSSYGCVTISDIECCGDSWIVRLGG